MTQPDRRPPGRPRQNIEGNGDGNPSLQIRMPREKKELVQERGGATWAREVLDQALPKELDPELADFRSQPGKAILCYACREIKRYGLLINLSDGRTGSSDFYVCKGCISKWNELLPGEDTPSHPSNCQPEDIGN